MPSYYDRKLNLCKIAKMPYTEATRSDGGDRPIRSHTQLVQLRKRNSWVLSGNRVSNK